jgi:DoxX-like family
MQTRGQSIAYWIATGIFAAFLLMDGGAGLMREATGREVMLHLGYPVYVMSILGGFKIAAAIAIVQTRLVAIKEWAFAGFWISCIGAFASRAFVGDSAGMLVLPWVFLGISIIPYVLWKQRQPAA